MDAFLFNLVDLLTRPPGQWIYHLVITSALIITVILLLTTSHPQSQDSAQSRRIITGCIILLALQFMILGLSIAEPNPIIFVIIERLASILTVVWLMWMIIDRKNQSLWTGLSITLSMILILLSLIKIFIVFTGPPVIGDYFSLLDSLWQVGGIFLILIGITLLLVFKPGHHILGLFMLMILAAGYIVQLLILNTTPPQMGTVRLAQMVSLPWLLGLSQSFAGKKLKQEEDTNQKQSKPNIDKPINTKPALVDQLLKINLQKDLENKFKKITQALSLSIVADICYLVEVTDDDRLNFFVGYDLIREVHLKSAIFHCEELPIIMSEWEKGNVASFGSGKLDSDDKTTIRQLLNYHQFGNLLAFPLFYPDDQLVGGIMFFSPYTGKQWDAEAIQLLDKINEALARVLFEPEPIQKLVNELDRARNIIQLLFNEKEQYQEKISQLDETLNEKENNFKQLKAQYQLEKLETVQKIDQLTSEIKALQTKIENHEVTSPILEQLHTEIRQLSSERDHLKIALERANARIRDLEVQSGQTGPIRLSMEHLIISLDSVIANVKLKLMGRLQQKQVNMEIHNPNGRQMIKTDPELLQNVIHGLLENAVMAVEKNGTVKLDLDLSFETGMLIIQVTDFGEGLTSDEQTTLFQAQQNTIPGIGSVNALREAIRAIRVLNGKIWLRSKKGAFTTFRVQLPVRIID